MVVSEFAKVAFGKHLPMTVQNKLGEGKQITGKMKQGGLDGIRKPSGHFNCVKIFKTLAQNFAKKMPE